MQLERRRKAEVEKMDRDTHLAITKVGMKLPLSLDRILLSMSEEMTCYGDAMSPEQNHSYVYEFVALLTPIEQIADPRPLLLSVNGLRMREFFVL
jgi:hypothetical protein